MHQSELTIEAQLPDAGLFPDNLGARALALAYGFAEELVAVDPETARQW